MFCHLNFHWSMPFVFYLIYHFLPAFSILLPSSCLSTSWKTWYWRNPRGEWSLCCWRWVVGCRWGWFPSKNQTRRWGWRSWWCCSRRDWCCWRGVVWRWGRWSCRGQCRRSEHRWRWWRLLLSSSGRSWASLLWRCRRSCRWCWPVQRRWGRAHR